MAGRDESVQVAKEEEEEGLIFSVNVEHVRHLAASWPRQEKLLGPRDSSSRDSSVSSKEDLTKPCSDPESAVQIPDYLPSKREKSIRTVKAGTVKRLIEYLAPFKTKVDVSYRTCFLATYRTFTTPKEILTVLKEWFAAMTPKSSDTDTIANENSVFQGLIYTFLHNWLEKYPEDFHSPPLHTDLCALEVLSQQCIGEEAGLAGKVDRVKKESTRKNIFFEVENLLSGDLQLTSSFSLFSLSAEHLVQGLTAEDNCIFQRVLPYQCLFYVRSSTSRHCPTVKAAISHFNRVTLVAIATILHGESVEERGKVIGQWIDITQQCRLVKNFSSLKAILSSLQSSAIYRLRKSWDIVPREKIAQLEELSHLFASDDNFLLSRDLLSREGTSKHVGLQISQKKSAPSARGVVPYLGTFLTDLTMIHVAHPDTLPNGMVNFKKRRKEFELLAQLTLYQKSALHYSFSHHPLLVQWLKHSSVFSEKESYEKSKVLEPDTPLDPENAAQKPLWKTMGQLFKTAVSDPFTSSFSRTFSYNVSEKDLCHSPTSQFTSILSPQPSFKPGSRNVRIEITGPSFCVYRTMEVREGDRAGRFVRKAMKKHGIQGDPLQYQLVMKCESLECKVPDDALLFYALPDSLSRLILTPKNASFDQPS